MNSTRKISTTTGAVFIVATVAALAAAAVSPALSGTDYLAGIASDPTRLAVAALLYLVAAGTCVGISIALYPVLRKVDSALALGSVVFRAIEAVFYTVAVLGLLSLLTLGQQLDTASSDAIAPIHAIADYVVSLRDHANVAAIFAFSVGASMYYILFFRSRLVPRWLSGWGIVASLLMGATSLLAMLGSSPVTGFAVLILPILIQEMVFAVWLLVRGFSTTSLTAATATPEEGAIAGRRNA